MQHYCWWNKYVANPIKKDGYQGPGRLAMRVLKEEILPAILLRRTKVQCADVLALPPRCAPLSALRSRRQAQIAVRALNPWSWPSTSLRNTPDSQPDHVMDQVKPACDNVLLLGHHTSMLTLNIPI